ncbi:hypothetical protein [Phyllobacterium myrsinacearum]|uniref:Uncharacterized protein n=1 Tax=Phyllobacterium myrsinacearum TaxID=28101 RepID=A0A839EPX5_9HYPH|nr:hypothetical protein [Phyllobacterium myrsinacearum]MBA8880872.1 hypothetical protein [Phyllobacterium myrsinacearum]
MITIQGRKVISTGVVVLRPKETSFSVDIDDEVTVQFRFSLDESDPTVAINDEIKKSIVLNLGDFGSPLGSTMYGSFSTLLTREKQGHVGTWSWNYTLAVQTIGESYLSRTVNFTIVEARVA